jgi:dGTPase
MKNPDKLPASYAEQRERDPLHRVVCDYIAGMTDRFILRQYEELFGKSDKAVFG